MALLNKAMRALCAVLLLAGLAGAADPIFSQRDIDSGKALKVLNDNAYNNAVQHLGGRGATCTRSSLQVRKEWYASSNPPSPHQAAREHAELT